MVVSLILAAALLAQDPPAPPRDAEATQLEEVLVESVPVREAADAFVRSVAEPIAGRKVARWRNSVCVGVGGLQAEAARFMVDRISDWAATVGLAIEPPGCEPQIFIVATDDGDATARALVASRPREFRTGASQSDRGAVALEAFQTSGAPIRWWHVSLPVNGDTGEPVRRLPGSPPFVAPREMTKPADLGSWGTTVSGSRLTDETQDDLMQAIIVLDMAALDQANILQVTDYIAMVSLAQIAPDADPESPSILRMFKPAEAQEDMLTSWDRAYLQALYRTYQAGAGTRSNFGAIAGGVARDIERREAIPAEPDATD